MNFSCFFRLITGTQIGKILHVGALIIIFSLFAFSRREDFFFPFLVASQPKRLIFPPSPLPSFLPDKWLAADFPLSFIPSKHPHTVHFCLFSLRILSPVQFAMARGAHIHIPIAVFCLDGSHDKKKTKKLSPPSPISAQGIPN